MAATREGRLVGRGKQIAYRGEIASCVRAAVGDLRSPVERCASAHHHGAGGLPRMDPARQIQCRSAVEIECPARATENCLVEETGREGVRFAQACDLLAQENVDQTV